ncbi:glycine-rich cell wall structural protein 1.8 [Drosophila busckii]|uniref:glycine-rich cell wall structural protein 1.8 n=1 Tax=Drosophila busckii TaxID=30019 RepID=UPI00083ECCAF|nr:glycine-rich cell wall structural protein 1.8 [Drosophila busckii]
MRKACLIASLALLLSVASAEEWVWRSYNRRERALRSKDIDRSGSIRNSLSLNNKLTREPTTRRPLPGQPENDEIEDYADAVEATPPGNTANVGTRQYSPYPDGNQFGGFGAQPTNVGQFGGGFGVGSPGVLVGPGGPTGIIGRQPLYPQPYHPGYGGFGATGQSGLGLGGYPGAFGGAYANPNGNANPAGNFAGFPGGFQAGGQAQFPGGQAQFPGGFQAGGQAQFPGGFPAGNQAQFPGAGAQFPFQGTDYNQFGGAAGLGQYPGQQYGGPQYTEGYGLASLGLGPTGYGGNYGNGQFGFDEKTAEGKSAKSIEIKPTAVNDKLNKKL